VAAQISMLLIIRRVLFIPILVVVWTLALESIGTLVSAVPSVNRAMKLEPYPSLPPKQELPDSPTLLSLQVQSKVTARMPDTPAGGWRQENLVLDGRPVAIIVGGSSPYGDGVSYKDSAWGILENIRVGNLRYVNGGIPSAPLLGAAIQLVTALDTGNVKVAAIYAGDNEWGPFDYPRLSEPHIFSKLDYWLYRHSTFYNLLGIVVRHRQSRDSLASRPEYDSRNWFHFHRFCFNHRVSADDDYDTKALEAYRQRVTEVFSRTLDVVIAEAVKKGATLILYTTPIRYRMTPCHGLPQFLSEKHYRTSIETEIQDAVQEGLSAYQRGELDLAESRLRVAYELDPSSTLTNHYLGYLYESSGNYEAALKHFGISRDRKVGKNGLLPTYNQVVRQKGDPGGGVFVIDLDRSFLQRSRSIGKGFNDELIKDWCHPNKDGHRLIAEETEALLRRVLRR
jgi:hypothetical protein